MRCGAVVVYCNPSFEVVSGNWKSRKEVELLQDIDDLKKVYDLYQESCTHLPYAYYNYTMGSLKYNTIEAFRHSVHPCNAISSGNWNAKTILIGDSLNPRRDFDPLHTLPFCTFSKVSCGQWLSGELNDKLIEESDLLWVSGNQDLTFLKSLQPDRVVCLGQVDGTSKQLYDLNILHTVIPHPDHARKEHDDLNEPYELFNHIR